MTKQFAGKVALVTGGGAGIGRASALTSAREGAQVVVSDRNAQDAERTAHEIEALGSRALLVFGCVLVCYRATPWRWTAVFSRNRGNRPAEIESGIGEDTDMLNTIDLRKHFFGVLLVRGCF